MNFSVFQKLTRFTAQVLIISALSLLFAKELMQRHPEHYSVEMISQEGKAQTITGYEGHSFHGVGKASLTLEIQDLIAASRTADNTILSIMYPDGSAQKEAVKGYRFKVQEHQDTTKRTRVSLWSAITNSVSNAIAAFSAITKSGYNILTGRLTMANIGGPLQSLGYVVEALKEMSASKPHAHITLLDSIAYLFLISASIIFFVMMPSWTLTFLNITNYMIHAISMSLPALFICAWSYFDIIRMFR